VEEKFAATTDINQSKRPAVLQTRMLITSKKMKLLSFINSKNVTML